MLMRKRVGERGGVDNWLLRVYQAWTVIYCSTL